MNTPDTPAAPDTPDTTPDTATPAAPETAAVTLGFEDMGLRAGMSLFMRPKDAGATSPRYRVEYIGAAKGRSLLVALPVVDGRGLWMQNGQEYVFHVVEGMYVYAFTSRVLRARSSPYPYVHFGYPAHIEARQIRKSYRVRMRLPVTVTGGAARRDAQLLDLSMTGALLEAPADAWEEGDALTFALPLALEETHSQLTLSATLRNRVEKQEGRAHFGVEFGELPQNDALLLHYYIDHAIAMRLG